MEIVKNDSKLEMFSMKPFSSIKTKFLYFFLCSDLSLQLGSFIQTISKAILAVDLKYVVVANVKSAETNVDEIMSFSLENLSNRYHPVRLACLNFMKKLSKDLILCDVKGLQNRNDSEQQEMDTFEHSLLKFQTTILKFHAEITKFNNR